ncbi:unnamed protein product [Adineta steineri]|uniref:Uncharacterized protein n=1 Tax=Adineta steineri TaxID=433720 RepID=A0A818LI21_9BILA|nr:unnamed protein product [Adineta steineri]CAF3572518.1 unnamed protein product [Adineta steineri]
MPRVSNSNDYLLGSLWCTPDNNRYYRTLSSSSYNEQPSILSPNEIDKILSRKLYNELKITPGLQKESNIKEKTEPFIDPELIMLIDHFFNLTYLNTIPMVNLLATAVATNFLKENIRELDKKLQEEQAMHVSVDIKRGNSLLYEHRNNSNDDDDDDDKLSWASAPT